ncbi:MAG: phosphatidylserine decarboxylase [Magnetococcales bacterium]|nr:phosphatidylserine decarboxylase [Magnetococcales bacterium]NGZ28824.1 phosphatidylserine decarboxylase [Magnetococcales bacterium]
MLSDKVQVFDWSKGEKGDLPIPAEVKFLLSRWGGKLGRFLLLNRMLSKMAGFVLCSRTLSAMMYASGLAKVFNSQIAATGKAHGYATLNQAFTHRYPRPTYPVNQGEASHHFLVAPCDAYLSMRPIVDSRVAVFPGLWVDLPTLLGDAPWSEFVGGSFLLFTLKPHHDHTLDFPLTSRIHTPPVELAAKRWRVGSTDPAFLRRAAGQGLGVLDQNHRVVTLLESIPYPGLYAFIEVGAMAVNSIAQDYDGGRPIHPAGMQKSHFNFGSTVILLLSRTLNSHFQPVRELMEAASGLSVCEVKRGNVVCFAKETPEGSYRVADTVTLEIRRFAGALEERILRQPA